MATAKNSWRPDTPLTDVGHRFKYGVCRQESHAQARNYFFAQATRHPQSHGYRRGLPFPKREINP
jgi:hypothetical protein